MATPRGRGWHFRRLSTVPVHPRPERSMIEGMRSTKIGCLHCDLILELGELPEGHRAGLDADAGGIDGHGTASRSSGLLGSPALCAGVSLPATP